MELHPQSTEEVYEKIDRDIEEALPLVSDANYAVPKYHFNRSAAYAFATRFNLYYLKWEKVVEYASEVLGSAPSTVMRDQVGKMLAEGVAVGLENEKGTVQRAFNDMLPDTDVNFSIKGVTSAARASPPSAITAMIGKRTASPWGWSFIPRVQSLSGSSVISPMQTPSSTLNLASPLIAASPRVPS